MIAQADFYDPHTFRIIVSKGEEIKPRQEKQLKVFGLYEIAVGTRAVEPIPTPPQPALLPPRPPAPETIVTPPRVVSPRIVGFTPNGRGTSKRASARVRLEKTSGAFIVNGEPFENYFDLSQQRSALEPFEILGLNRAEYSMQAKLENTSSLGTRQARALALAIADALVTLADAESKSEIARVLRSHNLVVR